MANNTSITLTGRLGADPSDHSTGTQSICTFRLGSSRGYYDRNKQAWREQPTTWVTVKTYRNLAANVSRSLHKGDPVIVSGYLVTEEWADRRTGERRSMNVIEATSVGHDIAQGISLFSRTNPGFLGRRREERPQGAAQGTAGAENPPPGTTVESERQPRATWPAPGVEFSSGPAAQGAAPGPGVVTGAADAVTADAVATGVAAAEAGVAAASSPWAQTAQSTDVGEGGADGVNDAVAPGNATAATVPDEFGTHDGGAAF